MDDSNALRDPTPDEDASWAAGARILAIPFDFEAFTNAIRVPGDAGDGASALEATLRRIPAGWARWIAVGRG